MAGEQKKIFIPTKKLKNGFEIPEYGLGTWQMGGRFERNLSNNDAADISAIQAAIKLGVTHIDTAEIYANGHAEELVKEAIREGKFDRAKLFIVSKVEGAHHNYEGVRASCKASLKRLGLEYLDLYLLHEYTSEFPLKETMRAMEELKQEGLIRNIGVSNFGVAHLQEAQRYSSYPIVCNQVHYNLRVREIEKEGLLEFCQQNDVMVVAYRPTEKGSLWQNQPLMIAMSKKYGKTPAQIALNWLISQKNVVTIVKTRSVEHLQENLGALGWQLERDDVEKLRREFPDQLEVSDVIPLG